MPGHDPTHSKILVELFPSQGCSAKLNTHPFERFIRGVAQEAITSRGESENSTIVKLKKYSALLTPSTHCQGFLSQLSGCDGIHGRLRVRHFCARMSAAGWNESSSGGKKVTSGAVDFLPDSK